MENNIFSPVLIPESVNISVPSCSNEELLDELVRLLSLSSAVTDRTAVRADLIEHEKKCKSFTENGVSFPHTRTTGVKNFCAAVAITRSKTIYVLTAWPHDSAHNLKLIADFVTFFQNSASVGRVLAAASAQEAFKLISPCFQTV